jgi:hypothetical protein
MEAASLPAPLSAPSNAFAPTAPASPATDVKVQLLQTFFALQAPTPEDRVPVALEDGRLYQFRPHYFLGAVANNFLGGTVAEHLTHEQRRAVFALEWFSTWLEAVVRIRAARNSAER